jgi:hypothetical protein
MKMRCKPRAIDKLYKRRDRYEIPEWQRQEVWSRSKKQNLIDTILRGWKLPKFYFLKLSEEPEEYEVVDGQQRLAAIFEFFDNELPLSEASAEEFGGQYYGDLPDGVTDAFDDYEIELEEIEDATDEEVKEFFQRLQEGLPLTSSEKLNSVHSNLRDFVMDQTRHLFFTKVTASDKRYGHFDILAKVAAIEIDGIDVGLRYDDLRAVFESQASFSPDSNVAQRIISALDFAHRGFAEDTTWLRNRTLVQSFLSLVCRLIQSGKATGKEKEVAQFFEEFLKELSRQVELGQRATEAEFLHFQRTVNANLRTGARVRQAFLLCRLLAHNPLFVEMFDGTAVAESGLQTAIRSEVGYIVRLIAQINQRYSAEQGEDLFKATNRTAQAQLRMSAPIGGFREYEAFIDDLYFLFWESVGERLKGKIPESFSHVNMLRTDLRHDLDHGNASKARAKRKKAGQVFAKYSGAPSPAALAPERFVIVQANLLSRLKADLYRLTW